MTKPKFVFNPVAQDYFDNPYEIYKRMRDEAPIYYDEQEDFYALTRHEDVARGVQGPRRLLVERAVATWPWCGPPEPPQKSIIFMDPPDHRHMRSLLNKVFTPRAIQAQRETVVELVEHYLSKADPDDFDVVQDFSGPFPVEVITPMAGVPEEFRQQVRHWIDKGLHRKPGQIELDDDNMQANIDSGMYLLRPDPGAPKGPAGRHDQPADRRRNPRRETARCASSTTSRSPDSWPFSAARAPRRSPNWSEVRWSSSPEIPDQWQNC